jgi:hypothetical protein
MPESERPAALVPSATEAATSRSYLPVNSITRVLGLGANVPNLDGVQKRKKQPEKKSNPKHYIR